MDTITHLATFYTQPFGTFESRGRRIPHQGNVTLRKKFEERAMNYAKAMAISEKISLEDLKTHFENCRLGSENLANTAELWGRLASDKQELVKLVEENM